MMTVSKKQLEANKRNAQKGGVKTPEGKSIVKYNALKHGLLAKESVIAVGDGAENPEEFNALLEDLKAQLKPEGVLEEMLTEKIAVAYWRLRRAYKYEVGLIRNELDNATNDYYSKADWEGEKINKTDEEIEQEIEKEKEGIEYWKKDKRDLTKMHKAGKPLEEIFDWEDNWGWLEEKVSYYLSQYEKYGDDLEAKKVRELLNRADWSDDQLFENILLIYPIRSFTPYPLCEVHLCSFAVTNYLVDNANIVLAFFKNLFMCYLPAGFFSFCFC